MQRITPMEHATARCRLLIGLLFVACPCAAFRAHAATPEPGTSYDVVVYGGTSAAVAAAVQAARMGKSVVVVSPDVHLGGLSSGGLGWTDSGRKEVIGGIARQLYQRIKQHYDRPEAWRYQKPEEYSRYRPGDDAMWVFEPHVAEAAFERLVAEHGVRVDRDQWLDRSGGVRKEGTRLVSITTLGGKTYRGRTFIDATYEGDLMAAAGVSYTVGREPNAQYGETLNGVQTENAVYHQFLQPVDPYRVPGDPSSGLLPRIHAGPPGEEGSGDHRVQAYCFRMCLTTVPANRVPFAKPAGYDPIQYELLARYLQTGGDDVFRKFDPAPNAKTDTNNHGAFSTDNIGMNYDYPEASYERRREIIREHEVYQKGLMYFLANDPRVPEAIRTEMSRWGLAADEFTDNGHWPHQIYVREARRMVAPFVMTELHLTRVEPTPDPIGMGSYNMDSHNVQRYVDADGHARNEGDVQISPGGPYPVSYRAITPKASQCENLLVPVCLSASHIAYGSIRMEPVFMILGQSAATAACQAIDQGTAVQAIDVEALRKRLLADGQVLAWTGPRASRRITIASLSGIVVDDRQAELTGEWLTSSAVGEYVQFGYRHDDNAQKGKRQAVFRPKLPRAGRYEVRVAYAANPNRATNVPVTIVGADGTTRLTLNQRESPKQGPFASLGTYRFAAGDRGSVVISNEGTDGYVIVDAVQFIPEDPAPGPTAAVPDSGQRPPSKQSPEEDAREIFRTNDTYTWLREQLLRRMPDGSLCCVFFTGGSHDGHARNLVACIRSHDDGRTWTGPEIVASRPDQGCWAPSLFRHKDTAYLFWFTKSTGWRDMTNRLMSTGKDGRTFTNDRTILEGWNPGHIVDVRHGTHLRDGRVLLPIAWQEPLKPTDAWKPPGEATDLRNVGGDSVRHRVFYVGVMEPNDDFTEFRRYGRVCKRTPHGPTPSIPFFENAIAELPDGRLAMLIRADTTNRLWRTDSADGGRTWSEPHPTDIPNPGSKPRIINLPDGRIVLFHNPSEKDYSDLAGDPHKYRTPLAMWLSDDGMKTWAWKRTLVAAPKIAQYPDGFYDAASQTVYLAWEDGQRVFFQIISLPAHTPRGTAQSSS